MIHGRGPSLEFLADAAKLTDKFSGLADGLVCLADLIHCGLKLRGNIGAAVFAKVTVCIRIVLKICVEFDIVKFHFSFLQIDIVLGWFRFYVRFLFIFIYSALKAPPAFHHHFIYLLRTGKSSFDLYLTSKELSYKTKNALDRNIHSVKDE